MTEIKNSNPGNRRHVPLYVYIAVLFLSVGVLAALKSYTPDSDTWFLAATGRYIVKTGTFPTTNPFVAESVGKIGIVVQQWLFDVLIYFILDAFGNAGVYVWCVLTCLAAAALIYRWCSLYTANPDTRLLVSFCASVFLVPYMTARPSGLSILVFLAEACLLKRWRDGKSKVVLWTMPLMSVLLVNLHASMWVFLFVFACPFLLPDEFPWNDVLAARDNLARALKYDRPLLLSMLVSVPAGLLNPYGWRGAGYLFLSYGAANSIGISELQEPPVASSVGYVIIACAVAITVLAFKNRKKMTLPLLFLAGGCCFMAMLHLRNGRFLVIGAVPLLCASSAPVTVSVSEETETFLAAAVPESFSFPVTKHFYKTSHKSLVLTTTAAVVFAAAALGLRTFNEADSAVTPVEAADWLDENAVDGASVYTGFNYGAYMEWRGYKVYIDARPELYSPLITGGEDVLEEWIALENGLTDPAEFFEEHDFGYVIAVTGSVTETYFKYTSDAVAVVEGDGYTLYDLTGGF